MPGIRTARAARRKSALGTLAVAAISTLLSCFLAWQSNAGLSVDLLTLLTAPWRELRGPGEKSQVAIIAIDEETFRRQPFSDLPRSAWTPQLATVIRAVIAAKPSVLGLDVIYGSSNDMFVPDYDREFLRALHEGAQEGWIILGYAQHTVKPVQPHRTQIIAVGVENVRATNAIEDKDGVIRRMPVFFSPKVRTEPPKPSFSLTLAERGSGQKIPVDDSDSLLLNFNRPAGAPIVYSLADMHACASAGNQEYFRAAFADRIVILGTILDVEDRRASALHFSGNYPHFVPARRCAPPVEPQSTEGYARGLVPGILLQARAVDNLLAGSWLRPMPGALVVGLAFLASLATSLGVLRRSIAFALGAMILLMAAWAVIACILFIAGFTAPLLLVVLAMIVSLPVGFGYRAISGDRSRQRLAEAFTLYLPRSEVNRILAEDQPPILGGERRRVAILFADIADFTRTSEHKAPEIVVSDLNRYFSAMTTLIEVHGGFVDKFIGDGLLAVFGAPLTSPDFADKAVRAALAMQEAVANLNSEPSPSKIAIRVGLNIGDVIIGNIGAPRRFNYTVIGDAVNLAARLEGMAKKLGAGIVINADLAEGAAGDIALRPLPRVRVFGRAGTTNLAEPLSAAKAQVLDLTAFATALAAFTSGDFAKAADGFSKLAEGDSVSRNLAALAHEFQRTPPEHWDGTLDMLTKSDA